MPVIVNKKVIVIGAGLGGLSAAISLASEGFQVEVYDKNDKVGGKLNSVEKDGFTFDLGPSILTLPHIFEKLFTKVGKKMEDYIPIQEVKPHWRNFFEDGTVIDLHPDREIMEKELSKLSPDESRGFFAFLDYSKKLSRLTEEGYFKEGLDSFSELLRFYGPIRSLFGFDAFRNMDSSIRKFVKNQKLVDILGYFIKYVGSSPYHSPALMNLLPNIQFEYGLWYVKGGMYNIAVGLEKLAKELGVAIHLQEEIGEIIKKEDKVLGIRLNNDKIVFSDFVVSNMEVIPAMKNLLKENHSHLKQFEKFEPSCSGLVLHLGVNRKYPQLAHHNFFYSRNSKEHFESVFRKKVLPKDPTIYLVAPCKTDPRQAPEGMEVIKILPHIPHIQENRPYSKQDYLEFRDITLTKLERMGLIALRKHIVCEEMLTPYDIQSRYFSNQGSIYGVVTDRFKNLGFKAPQRSPKYRNLYFVGGSVNPGGGMPMVTLSGQLVRDKILQDIHLN